MTIRDVLDNVKRRASGVILAAWVLFTVSEILSSQYKLAGIVSVGAFVWFFIAVIYLLYGIRCPECRNMLGFVTSYVSSPLSISRRIKFCPFCGIDIDKPVDAAR